jgi:putative phage-type endonuclease
MRLLAGGTGPDVDRAAWLEWRRGGLGASDVAQLVPGLAPWGSPWALWCDKVGLDDPDDAEESEAMRWGRLLEGPIADEFERRTGLHVGHRQARCTHPDEPWARCTVDGIASESDRGDGPTDGWSSSLAAGCVETKNTAYPTDWADGAIPDHYVAQGQWQMWVTGLSRVWFAVLLGGRRLHIVEHTRDDALIGPLVELAGRFWHDHVIAGVPPASDGSEATTLALARSYRAAAAGITVPLDDLADDVGDLRALRAERAGLDTRIRAHENRIKAALGPAEAGSVGDDIAVTWRQVTSRRIDIAALEADHPDLVARYRHDTTSRRFLIRKEAAR